MANKSTRKECFERQLFGLPYDHTEFVMEVKTGILLFLYDFQEKNMYGVFEAASDGSINIMPDAYKSSSHMKFPAQVQFSTLWHCDPLPEHVFRDAIKENYYAPFKFHLGLSRDQVIRLLSLFEKRMVKIPTSPVCEIQDQRSSQMVKYVGVTHSCSRKISDIIEESITELQASILGKTKSIQEMQDSIQEMIPDKLGNSDTSEHEQSESDYIPLPSIEPDEIEDPAEVFQWDAMSFTEVGECLMKPLIWLPGHNSSLGSDDKNQVDSSTKYHVEGRDSESSEVANSCSSARNITGHKKNDDSSEIQVQGMYSDSSKNRTSAFLRLSGLGKVMVEEHHCHNDSKMNHLRDILKGLDMRNKMWDRERSSENVPKSRASVFSRLRSNEQAQERDQNVRFCAGDGEPMDVQERLARESFKRKSYDHLSSRYYWGKYKRTRI